MAKRRGRGEGSISQRADGRWQARVDIGRGEDGRRRRKTVYGATRAAVATELNKLLGRSATGELLNTTTPTLAVWLNHWYQTHRKNWRGSTPRIYRTAIDEWIGPMLGPTRLDALKPNAIQKWINEKTKAGARGYVVTAHVVLREALRFAMRQRQVTFNAAELVTVPRPEAKPIDPLTVEDAAKLIEVAASHRLGACVVTTLALGLRIGEATGTAWPSLDLDERCVDIVQQLQPVRQEGAPKGAPQVLTLVPLKTKASRRTLTLPATLVELLQAHRRRQLEERMRAGADWRNADNLVFAMPDGAPLQPSHVRRAYAAMLRLAGVKPKRYHDLRHSCATLLLARKEQLVNISKALGHSSTRITGDIYSHFVRPIADGVADHMDAVLKTGSKA